MLMRVGLQYVLNDPVRLIYTPVIIFSLICMYITQNWLSHRVRISLLQYYYTRNDDLQTF